MKKRMMVKVLVILLCLIGCKWWYNETHEIVDIGLSGNGSIIMSATYPEVEFNSAKFRNQIIPNYGLEMILDKDIESIRFVELPLPDKKVVSLHFYCTACGHDKNLKITDPEVKILSCDCPEDGDENNNVKKYFCIIAYKSSVSE